MQSHPQIIQLFSPQIGSLTIINNDFSQLPVKNPKTTKQKFDGKGSYGKFVEESNA